MRAVVQRVKEATVSVNGKIKGRIEKGLLLYAGVEKGDTGKDAEYIARKLAGLRILSGCGKTQPDRQSMDGLPNCEIMESSDLRDLAEFTSAKS